MREIKMSQFGSAKEIVNYLNKLAANSQGAEFFDEYGTEQLYANLFIENLKSENIQLFEYEYLLPANTHKFSCKEEEQEESKYILLQRFRGRGSYIEAVRETVLLFIHQSFSELEIHSGNVLVDVQSKSAIFTGSFTVSKLFDFIDSNKFDMTEKIFVFPYHRARDLEDAPFDQQQYFKIIVANDVKKVLQEKKKERFKEIVSKMDTMFSEVAYDNSQR